MCRRVFSSRPAYRVCWTRVVAQVNNLSLIGVAGPIQKQLVLVPFPHVQE